MLSIMLSLMISPGNLESLSEKLRVYDVVQGAWSKKEMALKPIHVMYLHI